MRYLYSSCRNLPFLQDLDCRLTSPLSCVPSPLAVSFSPRCSYVPFFPIIPCNALFTSAPHSSTSAQSLSPVYQHRAFIPLTPYTSHNHSKSLRPRCAQPSGDIPIKSQSPMFLIREWFSIETFSSKTRSCWISRLNDKIRD